MKALLAASFVLAIAVASSVTASAATPSLMSYQGRVSDAAGLLIGTDAPTNRTVMFKFYNVSTGGTPLYAEAQTVTISAGEFSVLLGNGTGVSGFKGRAAPALTPYINLASIMQGDLYLGITINTAGGAAGTEITPRQQIVAAAYAFRAHVADALDAGALSTAMLANTAVTTEKISGAAVTTDKLDGAAVTTAKIANANVTADKLANGAVTTAKIANNAIVSALIADGAIVTADLANHAVTTGKIANNAVGSAQIADATVGTVDLANGAVTTAKVASGAIDYAQLAAAVQHALTPAGTIVAYGGNTAPAGWLLCNGAQVSRTTYAALYAVVGNRFGHGNNSSTFHVPDFRGRFLRGWANGSGHDPDRNSRGAMNAGGAAGDSIGSVQGDMFRSHSHGYNDIYYSESGGDSSIYNNSRGSGDTDWDNEPYQIGRTTGGSGGNETRPTNAAVNYIIKY